MAAICEVCGKGPGFGMRVSHSHRRSRRQFRANIQKRRVVVEGTPKRMRVCTRCLKAGKIANL